MPLKFKKFRNIDEANHVLTGGIVGGPVGDGGIDQIVGKKLTFTAPAGTVTFTQGTKYQGRLTFAEIKAQAEAAIANLRVVLIDRKIAFRHASGTAVTLAAVSDDHARPPLGLPLTAVAGVVYAGPGGANPKVVQFSPQGDTIHVLTEET